MGEPMAVKKNKITAVDLFCGVGGLTYGLEQAGIRVVAGIDIDPDCLFPYEANTGATFIQKSVEDLTVDEVNQLFGKAEIRLLAGCAPCQPFSSHTKGKDTSEDPKWPLLDHFTRLIEGTNPHLVTMENVARIQRHAVFKRFVDNLESRGYEVVWASLYGPDYGIPQERRRLVVLASRIGSVQLPVQTHARDEYVTVRDAIGHLPRIKSGSVSEEDPIHVARNLSPLNLERLRHSKPGGTWKDWPVELRSQCHTKESGASFKSVYGRMQWQSPSPTITTQYPNFGTGRFGHPSQLRAISLREGAILQSFPMDYEFVAPGEPVHLDTVARLIGNAVPPRLGEVIGLALVKAQEQAS